jgi:hypothetical protein
MNSADTDRIQKLFVTKIYLTNLIQILGFSGTRKP